MGSLCLLASNNYSFEESYELREKIINCIQDNINRKPEEYKKELNKILKEKSIAICRTVREIFEKEKDDNISNKGDEKEEEGFPLIIYFFSYKLKHRLMFRLFEEKWFSIEEEELTKDIFSNPRGKDVFHILGEAVWKEYVPSPITYCYKSGKLKLPPEVLKKAEGIIPIELNKNFEDDYFNKNGKINKKKLRKKITSLYEKDDNSVSDKKECIKTKYSKIIRKEYIKNYNEYKNLMVGSKKDIVEIIQAKKFIKNMDEIKDKFKGLSGKKNDKDYEENEVFWLTANPIRHFLSPFEINNIIYIKDLLPKSIMGGVVFSFPNFNKLLDEVSNGEREINQIQKILNNIKNYFYNYILSPIIIYELQLKSGETYEERYFRKLKE